ncbi:hypothetical protein PP935_gp166 [Rhizobium phage RHph_N34]|uniref:Uncharacterized protein n=1 Tax=Rhizobium phage RHph_N34 TaxID=2509586 RepID=A0A7S5UYV9_9CAUD|nr:hypothetical protein PP935_gp166 [Rhizobium phage RHph_N34]QIG73941.1 hypothetical protein EVC06_166 [Rhizobium phage RHph_N34]
MIKLHLWKRNVDKKSELFHRLRGYTFAGYKHPTSKYIVEVRHLDDRTPLRLHHVEDVEYLLEEYC